MSNYPDNFHAAASSLYPTRAQLAAEREVSQDDLNRALDTAQNNACHVVNLIDETSTLLENKLHKLMLVAIDSENATPEQIAAVRKHDPLMMAAAKALAEAVAAFCIDVEAVS